MSILTLTSKDYKPGLKWSLLPISKIDTVQMHPLQGSTEINKEPLYTAKFTEVNIAGNTLNLPVDDLLNATHVRYAYNTDSSGIGLKEFAKSRVECVMASIETEIHLDAPIKDITAAEIRLKGKSYEITRGSRTYDSYPSYAYLAQDSYRPIPWIKAAAIQERDELLWSYNNNTFSMNPFVRNWSPTGDTSPEDIITTWWVDDNTAKAKKGNWFDSSNFGNNPVKRRLSPVGATYQDVDAPIELYDLNIRTYANIVKIDEQTLKLSWSAPVRLAYVAAARKQHWLTGYSDIDNWAFADIVSSVEIDIYGVPLSKEYVDVSFSYDSKNALTENIINKYPVKIEKTEGFTLDTMGVASLITELYPSKALSVNGEEISTESDQYVISDYANVLPGEVLDIRASATPGNAFYVFYDVVKNIEKVGPIASDEVTQIQTKVTVPDYVAFMRISGEQDMVPRIERPLAWVRLLPHLLLYNYRAGKYVVECSVTAAWALRRGIHINTRLHVYLQDHSVIKRNDKPCVFEVKNIEKIFNSNEFIYRLKLREV